MITSVFIKKKYYFYLIRCEFVVELDKNFSTKIETKCSYNTDITNIKRCLLYYIDSFKSRVYKFYNIN